MASIDPKRLKATIEEGVAADWGEFERLALIEPHFRSAKQMLSMNIPKEEVLLILALALHDGLQGASKNYRAHLDKCVQPPMSAV